jgi:hypothetical protein
MATNHIPLSSAYLCVDCNCISDDSVKCPACTSGAVMPLAMWLNRKSVDSSKESESEECQLSGVESKES